MSARATPTRSLGAALADGTSARARAAAARPTVSLRWRMASGPPPGARRDQLRQAGLARLHVEDRLVSWIAGEEALVGDDQPPAGEHDARRGVEWDRRAVVARLRQLRKSLDLTAARRDHGDLVAARERHVDVARLPDGESVRAV